MSFTKQCVEDSYYKATMFRFIKVCEHNVLFINHSPPGNMHAWFCLIFRPLNAHIQPIWSIQSNLMNIELSCWPMGFYGESWNQAMRRSANFLTPTLSSLLVRWRWGMTDCLVATAVISLIKVLLLVWVRSDLKGGGLCNTGLSSVQRSKITALKNRYELMVHGTGKIYSH